MKRVALALFAGIALQGASTLASAENQPILGQRLVIRNHLPDDESKNQVTLLARGVINVPAAGSLGDPTCSGAAGGGALFRVSSPTSGESFSAVLPCENWQAIKNGGGYEYLDRELDQGPCKRAQVRRGRHVKVFCQGAGPTVLDFDLQLGVHQSPVDLLFKLGSGAWNYCMQYGGTLRKNGTDAEGFIAARAPVPSGSCPP